MSKLTHSLVKELFDYDPHTGKLTHAKDSPPKGKKGREAGWVTSYGYRRVGAATNEYFAHLVIWLWMTGTIPEMDVDHKDGNRDNNKWDNLRLATRSQNLINQGLKLNNKSGFKGVCSRGNSHSVRLRVNGKVLHFGSFSDPLIAARVYDIEAVRHHGEFAKTNKSLGLIE